MTMGRQYNSYLRKQSEADKKAIQTMLPAKAIRNTNRITRTHYLQETISKQE